MVLILSLAANAGIAIGKIGFLKRLDAASEDLGLTRAKGMKADRRMAENYRHAVNYIKSRTRPDERVYVGLIRHDIVEHNDVMFSFLAERVMPTRYFVFDPGIQTTARVQEEMIWDIRKHKVRYAVLWATIPSATAQPGGSRLLDTYLAEHFRAEISFGEYLILRRVKR